MARSRQPSTPPAGFDFTLHMRRLCEDVTDRVAALRYVDMSRVAISFCQTRRATEHGLFATLTPMRFSGGREYVLRGGQRWASQRLVDESGREMLYILGFYLPRFLERTFDEKLATITHELWHINPKFNGDIRRHGGRFFAHGPAGDHDAVARRLAREWLALAPPEALYAFLRLDFHSIRRLHGPIFGRKIPTPKLFPLDASPRATG
ncbi:MAG: hypothetical protein JW809_12040 [Pirellulales bacterium]|nr:hypothetical protein [Pirellulales bacterium]